MAESSDDEDDAPMLDTPAPPEPELIVMPPTLASATPMSNLEWCIALRLVYGAGPRRGPPKWPLAPYLSVSLLSHVMVVPCVLPTLVCPRPDHHTPRLQDSDRQKRVCFLFHRCCCETKTKETNM